MATTVTLGIPGGADEEGLGRSSPYKAKKQLRVVDDDGS